MNVRCWLPAFQTEDGGRDYDMSTMREAVEAFARFSFHEDEFTELEVCCRDRAANELYSFQVEAKNVMHLESPMSTILATVVLEFDIGMGTKIAEGTWMTEQRDARDADGE
jgi:hypothetical protein